MSEPDAQTIGDRWRLVRARVDAACERAKRDPREVTIVAVSKTHPASAVLEAAAAGATDFGENYAQELVEKRTILAGLDATTANAIRWHFIGRLQKNKAKLVAGKLALIHAVDDPRLAYEIAKRSVGASPVPQPILVSINVEGEAAKGGGRLDKAAEIVRQVGFPFEIEDSVLWPRVDGLMTMPPPSEDPERSRPAFRALRALRDRIQKESDIVLPILSMGMSNDFEVAIEEGATHVRIGTAIFGARPPKPDPRP